MPGSDVPLCVRMHVRIPAMPEKPDVLLICNWFGVEKIVVHFRIRAQIKEVLRNGMHARWEWIGITAHCVLEEVCAVRGQRHGKYDRCGMTD